MEYLKTIPHIPTLQPYILFNNNFTSSRSLDDIVKIINLLLELLEYQSTYSSYNFSWKTESKNIENQILCEIKVYRTPKKSLIDPYIIEFCRLNKSRIEFCKLFNMCRSVFTNTVINSEEEIRDFISTLKAKELITRDFMSLY